MVTIDEAKISCEYTCAVCGDDMDASAPGVVVVRCPQFQAHAICAEDWSILIISAWAWISADTADDPVANRGRITAAYAAFIKENG